MPKALVRSCGQFGGLGCAGVCVRPTLSPYVRYAVFSGVLAFAGVLSQPALAWIETTPMALSSTVEVEADGKATVSGELTMRVRGGPLRSFDLPVGDADAEPLGDATVKKLPAGIPLPLLVERRADGALVLEVDHDKGLRSGTYLFAFRYRTDLSAQKTLVHRGESFELRWTGPRLPGGVDGVRTLVRLPASDTPPRLPLSGPDDGQATTFGVLVSGVRKTATGDEIELLRSYVSNGEPALWRVEASARAFPALVAAPEKAAEKTAAPAPRPIPVVRSPRFILAALVLGALVALLVSWKARAHAAAARLERARTRALVRLPALVRAPLAGLASGAALFTGAELEHAVLGGAFLVVALVLSTFLAPERALAPRGPGRWLPLSEDDAFASEKASLPGAWLDSTTLRGFALFALLVGAAVGSGALELGRSPYRALFLVLSSGVLLPLFFTGGTSDGSLNRVAFARGFLRRVVRKLHGTRGLKAVPWARVPDGSAAPDELRVLVKPRDALDGLVALEVALEAQRGLGGAARAPFVLVRVREGSRAAKALSPESGWTRGRKPEERVAMLSPVLPTLGLTVSLIERLVTRLSHQPPKSSRMSSGRSDSTRKLGSVGAPVHAT
jgi:hypothetical protein